LNSRNKLKGLLKEGEYAITMPNFPLLGARQFGEYTIPHHEPGGSVALSMLTPDQIIHPHFRFS
jgi:hypothetical protein